MAANDAPNIQGSMHIDTYLSNYSEMWMQDQSDFVVGRATTVIPVSNQSDVYVTYDRGYFWRDSQYEPRPLGGRPVQAGYKIGSGTYRCVEYALEHFIDDRQRANADSQFNLDENGVILLNQQHMIHMERAWAQMAFQSGVWTTEFTGVTSGPSSTQFLQFEQSGSDPVKLMREKIVAFRKSTGYRPNTIVAGIKVNQILLDQASIIERIQYSQIGVASESLLASLFGVDNYLVAGSIYNTANEGATDDFDWIIDDRSFWLGYISPNAATNSPTAMATFAWTGLLGGNAANLSPVFYRGRDDRAYTDWMHGKSAWDMRIVSQDLGMFFLNAVAA